MNYDENSAAAGIVTYNPDVEKLRRNLLAVLPQVNGAVIVDNGSDCVDRIAEVCSELDVTLIRNGRNRGIAAALNEICEWGKDRGLNWMLTLDQDTLVGGNLTKVLMKHRSDRFAIVAPNLIVKGRDRHKTESRLEEVQWVITSGSLTNLTVWKEIGGFDEKLFIDLVDKEYCLRAAEHGYKTVVTYEVCIYHELGKKFEYKNLFGRRIFTMHHSAFRKYYMMRNAYYVNARYRLPVHSEYYFWSSVLVVLLYEEQKLKKIKAMLRGRRDGRAMVKKLHENRERKNGD